MKINAYFKLMRFDKPIGIVLLWLPTAWALWLANKGMPPVNLLIYFALGTVCMRAAGCVMNDIADRNIDKHVQRTRLRPITSGVITLQNAVILLVGLLSIALLIVLQLPWNCLYYAFAALLVTIIYPFGKRFIQAPQLILGIAFSMGIPMVYVASGVAIDLTAILLILMNFAWIVSYDTMYAMVDRDDDLKIGVKSTAVLFADMDRLAVSILQMIVHSVWLIIGMLIHAHFLFYLFWLCAGVVLVYQQKLVNTREGSHCFNAFLMNAWYGCLMWFGLMVASF